MTKHKHQQTASALGDKDAHPSSTEPLTSSSSSRRQQKQQSSPANQKPATHDGNHQHRDDAVDKRGNPAACVFVASLTKEKNDEELNVSVTNHFSQWGTLLNVKVLKDWMDRPYAFVQYECTEDAKTALKEAPGTIIDGRSIRCEPARVNRTLCLVEIHQPLIKEEIQAVTSSFGETEEITILPSYPRTRCRNKCAFVKYRYRDDAIKAFLTLRSGELPAKWAVEWASNLDLHTSDFNLVQTDHTSVFVGNLSNTVTDESLRERFGQCGLIVYMKVFRKNSQTNHAHRRVFAFIKFKEEAAAAKAVQKENGAVWDDRPLRVAFREHRDSTSSCFNTWFKRSPERPHPPGMGYPASIYQYVVSGPSTVIMGHPASVPNVSMTMPPVLPRTSASSTGSNHTKDSDEQETQRTSYNDVLSKPGPGIGYYAGYYDPSTAYYMPVPFDFEDTPARYMLYGQPQDSAIVMDMPAGNHYSHPGYFDHPATTYYPMPYYGHPRSNVMPYYGKPTGPSSSPVSPVSNTGMYDMGYYVPAHHQTVVMTSSPTNAPSNAARSPTPPPPPPLMEESTTAPHQTASHPDTDQDDDDKKDSPASSTVDPSV